MGAGAAYTDPSGLQTADGSTLTDNGTGQGLTSLAATGSKSGKMFVFWGRWALGQEKGGPGGKGVCRTHKRGWIYTGSFKLPTSYPCYGYFYQQGDHYGPAKGCPITPTGGHCGPHFDKYAIDWQLHPGDKVFAQGPGTVKFAGPNGGYGYEVVVKYWYSGIGAWYGHLKKGSLRVRTGASVTASTVLALSDSTGHVTGKFGGHVHVGWGKPANFSANGGLPGPPRPRSSRRRSTPTAPTRALGCTRRCTRTNS